MKTGSPMFFMKKIFSVLTWREKVQAGAIFVLIMLGAAGETFSIGIFLPFLSLFSDPSGYLEYPYLGKIYSFFSVSSYQSAVLWTSLFIFMVFAGKNILLFFISNAQIRFSYSRQINISRRLLEKYLHMPYTVFFTRNSAELLRNINYCVPIMISGVMLRIFLLFSELLVVLCVLAFLFWSDPVSTAAVVVIAAAASGPVYIYLRKRIQAAGRMHQAALENMLKWVNQSLGGVKEIKVSHRDVFFLEKFTGASRQYAKYGSFLEIATLFPRYYLEIIAVSALLAVIIVNLFSGQPMQEILPVLGLFAIASFRIMPSVNRILAYLTAIRFNAAAADFVYEDLATEMGDAADTGERFLSKKKANSFDLRGCIECLDISYTYPGTDNYVLKEARVTIMKGTSTAIVGPSGAGKTTLADIILGLLQPDAGSVLVDGKDIREDLCSWQRKIGYVPQAVYLSDDSIKNNLAFGIDESQIEEKQIWRAIDIAGLREFVLSLPQGLETMVGEKGICLSGGQRQRIGIARALYGDPELLVLDEATSAVDSETERYISSAVERLVGEKTMIIIAHRSETIEKCDRVYSIKDKKIVLER